MQDRPALSAIAGRESTHHEDGRCLPCHMGRIRVHGVPCSLDDPGGNSSQVVGAEQGHVGDFSSPRASVVPPKTEMIPCGMSVREKLNMPNIKKKCRNKLEMPNIKYNSQQM